VAADTGFVYKKFPLTMNAVISHRAARVNLFLGGEIRMGQLGMAFPR
jgi:hypothetical protein